MYISIKKIKYSLMIFACIFFAGINYLSYVKADVTDTSCNKSIDSDCDGLTNAEEKLYGTDPTNPDTDGDGYSDGVEVKSGYDPTIPAPNDRITQAKNPAGGDATQLTTTSLTDSFSQDLKNYVASKGDTNVSNTDISNFVTSDLADKTSSHITVDTLPEVDASQIKIMQQNYSNLSESDRKTKMEQDATAYYTKIIYILISNAPQTMVTNNDFEIFKQNFLDHFATLASTSTDYAYFSDLGTRIDLSLTQINDIEVPQSMLSLHIKALRIIKGFLSLRELSVSDSDPVAKMMLTSKINDLITIATNYFNTDIPNYFNTITISK